LRHGTLFVRAFNAARQELTGPEIPLLQGVEYSTLNGAGQFDIAANGTLIYRAARAGSNFKTVQWMDRTGRLEPLLGTPADYRGISLSRDGKQLAIVNADAGGSDLYVYDVERHQQPVRLTVGANIRVEGGAFSGLAWNPDGRYLFFAADNATWWVPTEGLSPPHEFVKTYSVATISHDGTRLFASGYTRETRGDAWIVPLSIGRDGPQAGRPEPLLHESYTEMPFFDSPDGRWLAYGTDETGIGQTYVMELANPARKWMANAGSNGGQLGWSPAGREIFFTTFFAPLRIMVTSFSFEGGVFHPGQVHPWSPVAIPNHAGEGMAIITMAPDGKRFAVLMPAEQPLGNRVTFVMNFFDEVRRRIAPVK
jgi:WD40 repeat protein